MGAILILLYWKATTKAVKGGKFVVEDFASRIPICPELSLKEKANEENVDYNEFLNHLKNQKSDQEMADELGITAKTAEHLRKHFETVGVHSLLGQD